jgi:hypothetical protein
MTDNITFDVGVWPSRDRCIGCDGDQGWHALARVGLHFAGRADVVSRRNPGAAAAHVLGPLWMWLARIERPPAATVAGGVIVICAVVFQVTQP